MASLIPGYEYDIFISYRQKDNKHDGWVTKFVEELKGELESTFKEEISVYFDINPSDYLLESYDVDASLKDKLKCLVFIPIISRTYCDPKSFAWEHEFKAFVEQASHDHFGLKIKLPNGNVANRVLPVRIHDLDAVDIKECESALGGVLRGIEFIYKEPGVNRSLSPKDHEEKNLNNTNYRNQINKVALAIKEIISGLKIEPGIEIIQHQESSKEVKREEGKEVQEKPYKQPKRKVISGGIFIAVLLVIAAILTYPKLFKQDSLERLRSSGERISVAVMPFQNRTNDETKNYWQEMIQDILITALTNSEELKVKQSQMINEYIQSKDLTNYASITPSIARTISLKLDASVFIYGSIIKAGDKIRINAQLIDSKTVEAYKSFQLDGVADNILNIIDSLSILVENFLIISKLNNETTPEFQGYINTNSLEAYRYALAGAKAHAKRDYPTAVKLYSQAIAADSNLILVALTLTNAYGNQGLYDQAKELCMKIYKKRDQMSEYMKAWVNYYYAYWFETPYEGIKYAKQLLEYDDQSPNHHYTLADMYYKLYQYDKAIPEFEKILEIYDKWDSKPFWSAFQRALGYCYHKTGQYKKERKLYKKAEKDFPGDLVIMSGQATLTLTEGNTKDANEYIDRYKSILKEQSWSEVQIINALGNIYSDAEILDKAEEYYRKALSIQPESSNRMNTLAYFLIDKDRNIKEGLELADTTLKLRPDNFNYIHTKGWGLYKQGKYNEAIDFLQKSWDLRSNSVFSMQIYFHLEAAKKAVANQKNK